VKEAARNVLKRWRIAVALALPFVLLAFGAVGYRAIEGPGWSWNDAFYMSAITLTTVGYGETHPLSHEGRVFTIGFLFFGVFTLFYTATEIIRAMVSGQLQQALGRGRMERTLAHLKDHVIVCGLGRMGRLVCHEFEKQQVPFVIIDQDVDVLDEAHYEHGIPLHGDATSDEVLLHAGVARARAVVAVLPSDASNLYVTLSARGLNDKINIVARAEEESAIAKLRRVGADHVVSPYVIGGHRATQAVLKPTVGHFLEMAGRHDVAYVIEEITVEPASPLAGKRLRESRLREDHSVVVLTIKDADGAMSFNPDGDTVLEAGQVLVIVGHTDHTRSAKELGLAGTK
jgi:voltage-gated potassium channel